MAEGNRTTPLWQHPILDLSVDRYAAWENWKEKWNDYVVVSDHATKSEDYQCSVLRYTFTDETRKIYKSLKLSEENAKKTDEIIKALETFAKGIKAKGMVIELLIKNTQRGTFKKHILIVQ